MDASLSLDSARVADLPESCFYMPDFINDEEGKRILTEINKLPTTRWTVLSRRRLLSIPSALTGTNRDTLLAAPMPTWFEPIQKRFMQFGLFRDSSHNTANHILINEYKPGEGIMPHEDGPAYHPLTATISLGGHTVLEIYKKNETGEREAKPTWRILQEPRSLLVTTGGMYKNTLHSIAEKTVDDKLGPEMIVNWHMLGNISSFESGSAKRQTRISLTCRDVLKVVKVGGAMKFLSKR